MQLNKNWKNPVKAKAHHQLQENITVIKDEFEDCKKLVKLEHIEKTQPNAIEQKLEKLVEVKSHQIISGASQVTFIQMVKVHGEV